MNKRKFNKLGFTLVEMIVTIGIIAVISAGAMSVLGQGSRKAARNNRRKADLGLVQQALETYRNDKGGYPTGSNYACSATPPSNCLATGYIKSIPVDPATGSYTYTPSGCATFCTSYTLSATLENPTSTYTVSPL